MIKEYLDQFGSLILNPLVFLGIFGGLFFIIANKSNIKIRWILLALLAMVASFSEYRDQYVPDPPDLVFPLETIRSYGRPISVLLLSVLAIFTIWFKVGNQQIQDKFYIWRSLLTLQVLIFAKNLFYGDVVSAILLFLIFFLIFYLFKYGVSRWIMGLQSFRYATWTIVGVVTLFNLMGAYQMMIDAFPMFFQQNRYMGMTGNPQHAAVLLASGIPVFLYRIIDSRQLHTRVILTLLMIWTVYFLVLTGSRTGLLEAGISGLIFLFGYKTSSIKWVAVVVFGFLIIRTGINWDDSGDLNQNIEGYTSRENTRIKVINRQLVQFLQYPLFGVPLRGERMRYEENSYGAVLASLGLIGLIPLLVLVRGMFVMVTRLWKISRIRVDDRHYYLLVLAGLIALLVGAFLEAYLLGNLTWPLIMLFLYTTWGYYLLLLKEEKKVPEAQPTEAYESK